MARRAASLLAAAALALALPAAASASQTLTVQKLGAGEGTVASFPAGIDCGPTCSAPFADGATVALVAAWGSPTLPVQWSGCDSVNFEGKCFVTMGSARTVTAAFKLSGPLLTVAKSGAGTGTVTSSPNGIDCGGACSVSFTQGTTVTLTGNPGPHTKAAQWSGCDSVNGEGKCVVTMSAARSVTATFDLEAGYALLTLTVAKSGTGQGTVSGAPGGIDCGAVCSTELITGTAVTLTASPSPGSVFAHWSGGGCSGAGACTTTLNKAKTVKATFTLSGQRTLSVAKAGSGQGTVTARSAGIDCGQTCSAQVPAGKKLTLTAKAAKGSSFVRWSGACSGTAKTCKLTMSEARSAIAVFSAPPAPASPSTVACVVPRLKGKSLKQAKRVLRHAHCKLGKVRRPKGRKGQRLVVRSSKPGAGSKLGAGAKVGVKLGPAKRKKHRHSG
jgi:Divergent InlB B-repeat domain/PASTA domain